MVVNPWDFWLPSTALNGCFWSKFRCFTLLLKKQQSHWNFVGGSDSGVPVTLRKFFHSEFWNPWVSDGWREGKMKTRRSPFRFFGFWSFFRGEVVKNFQGVKYALCLVCFLVETRLHKTPKKEAWNRWIRALEVGQDCWNKLLKKKLENDYLGKWWSRQCFFFQHTTCFRFRKWCGMFSGWMSRSLF